MSIMFSGPAFIFKDSVWIYARNRVPVHVAQQHGHDGHDDADSARSP